MNIRRTFQGSTRAIAAAAFGVALTWAAAAAETPSYPMMCMPGDGMLAVVSHETGRNGRVSATIIEIAFIRADSAAAMTFPPPGTCAWMDRAIRPDEPTRLRARGDGAGLNYGIIGMHVRVIEGAGPEPASSLLAHVARGLTGTQPFKILARSSAGFLEITGIAP